MDFFLGVSSVFGLTAPHGQVVGGRCELAVCEHTFVDISFDMSCRWRPHGLSDFLRFRSGSRWRGGSPTVRKDGGFEAAASSWSRLVWKLDDLFFDGLARRGSFGSQP